MACSTPGLLVHHQLPEWTQTHVHWVGDAIQPSPLSSPSPPSFNLCHHQGLNESALRIRWPKYWSFSFNISPSNEYSGLISFRMDWLDCLAVQGILKSLFQHHSSKPSIIRCSAFFMVQFAHPYTTTGKTTVCTERLPNVMLTFLCPPALGSSCRTKLQNQGEAGAGRGAKRMPWGHPGKLCWTRRGQSWFRTSRYMTFLPN